MNLYSQASQLEKLNSERIFLKMNAVTLHKDIKEIEEAEEVEEEALTWLLTY